MMKLVERRRLRLGSRKVNEALTRAFDGGVGTRSIAALVQLAAAREAESD